MSGNTKIALLRKVEPRWVQTVRYRVVASGTVASAAGEKMRRFWKMHETNSGVAKFKTNLVQFEMKFEP
ncbi:hypothetical protein ACMD2_25619, partial [Ananas comosus]